MVNGIRRRLVDLGNVDAPEDPLKNTINDI